MTLRLVKPPSDAPVGGCQRVPVIWAPHDGWTHAGATLGVKWRCEECGFESVGVFGDARDLPEIAADALKEFINSADAKRRCVYWTTDVEQFVG